MTIISKGRKRRMQAVDASNERAASCEETTPRALVYNKACRAANRDPINIPDKSGVWGEDECGGVKEREDKGRG